MSSKYNIFEYEKVIEVKAKHLSKQMSRFCDNFLTIEYEKVIEVKAKHLSKQMSRFCDNFLTIGYFCKTLMIEPFLWRFCISLIFHFFHI